MLRPTVPHAAYYLWFGKGYGSIPLYAPLWHVKDGGATVVADGIDSAMVGYSVPGCDRPMVYALNGEDVNPLIPLVVILPRTDDSEVTMPEGVSEAVIMEGPY